MRMCSQVSPRGGKHRVQRSRRLDEKDSIGCIKRQREENFFRLEKLHSLRYFFGASVIESERE